MARDEDDDDSLPPLGENTDKFLDQAKKGQARNFLLVCKGNKVKYLAVRKKPIKKNELNEAKKSGYKGEGYFGVINGKGMELVFNLSAADGYTSEPVKDKILKDFLEEKADFKCKPSIVIVASLPEIPFDDEDLSNPLIARFAGLCGQIPKVLELHSDVGSEMTKTSSEIRGLLQEGEFSEAEPRVEAFEIRLRELLGNASADSTPSTKSDDASPQQQTKQEASAQSSSNDPNGLAAKLAEGLKRMKPLLEQVITSQPNLKAELVGAMTQLVVAIKGGQFDQAKQGMLALGTRLKELLGKGSSSSSTNAPSKDSIEEAFEKRSAALEPLLLKAQALDRERSTKLGTVWQYAVDQALAKNYAGANKALDGLEKAIQEILQATSDKSDAERLGIRKGLVAEMKQQVVNAKIRWDQAIQAVADEVRKVQVGVSEADPQLADALDVVVDDYAGRLDVVAARCRKETAPEELKKRLQEVQLELDEIQSQLAADDVIEFLEYYPFEKVALKTVFQAAFSDLNKQLAAALA